MNTNIDYKKFGKTIKLLRIERHLTQQNVCDATGISNSHYSNIEKGISKLSLDVLVSIANFFNISLSSSLLAETRRYNVPYDIKSMFSEHSDSTAADVLDIVAYAKTQLKNK